MLHDVVRCVVRGASGRVFTLASYGFPTGFQCVSVDSVSAVLHAFSFLYIPPGCE